MTKESLRKLRLDAHISVVEASRLVGVNVRTWHRWESGATPLNAGLVELFLIKTKNANSVMPSFIKNSLSQHEKDHER